MERRFGMVAVLWAFVVTAGCAGAPEQDPAWDDLEDKGLVPTKRVPPEYPRRAAMAGVQGCVTATFDVMPDGRTDNYEVVDSKPEGVFVKAALLALRDWRFPERDEPVRTQQTIRFHLGNQRADERPECETDSAVPEVYSVKGGR